MQVSFHLALPRDEASVPVTRRLIAQALRVVGVEPDTVSDVEIALSEACANVLRHAKVGDSYEVRAGFDQQRAFLEIIDQGAGFDVTSQAAPEDDAESGRGLALMRALMDRVDFEARSGDGTSVKLEKRLRFLPDSPITQLRPTAAPTLMPTITPDPQAEPTA
ncbi:MAG TPA: ATP-binding protein [Frankiaceae bacterium]|nr:ATP-binding protein [Frankiaceae bacterium]